MKVKFIPFLFIAAFLSCNKEDDCYTITEKRIVDNKYYFYFDVQENYDLPQDTQQGSGYPDRYASGQVDKETYDSTNVGDKYCN